jgi:hypothetical protein
MSLLVEHRLRSRLCSSHHIANPTIPCIPTPQPPSPTAISRCARQHAIEHACSPHRSHEYLPSGCAQKVHVLRGGWVGKGACWVTYGVVGGYQERGQKLDLEVKEWTHQFVQVFAECFTVLHQRSDGCRHCLLTSIGPHLLANDTLRDVSCRMRSVCQCRGCRNELPTRRRCLAVVGEGTIGEGEGRGREVMCVCTLLSM